MREKLLRLAPWLVIAVFSGLGSWSLLPPGPLPSTAHAGRFSAERAFDHVRIIAKGPHPMGSAALAEVRGYLVEELERLGIAVEVQSITVPDYYGGRGPVRVVNIIGRIPGTASTKAVALMAHYDTVPTTPGANDNTAAVATLLETGRALLAGPALGNDAYLLFTDGEEPAPRYGATAFVSGHPALGSLGLVVNLEASGGAGASLLVETSGPEAWLISELAAADSRPAALSALTAITRLFGDFGTDFDAFRNAGVPGFHFAYLHGSPIYHTEADDIDAVSKGSLQHHGEHALGIARHFGTLDLNEPGPGGDVVFFTVGSLFIRYSASWAVPLALVALVLGLLGWWNRRGHAAETAPLRALGLGRVVAAGLLATTGGTLLWLLITALRSTPGIAEGYLYLGCILVLAAVIAAVASPSRENRGRVEVLSVWSALSLLTAIWLPGFSYVFTWPTLAASAALWWRAEGGRALQLLRFSLVAAPTLILLTPAIGVFFQVAQPRPGNPDSELLAAVALPVLLAIAAWGLLLTAWPQESNHA